MNYNVRRILSRIAGYLCAVMLLNAISPCIPFAADADIVNIENDTNINEYVHTSNGILYSKYFLDENNNLSKNLFLNDVCIANSIIDFCVDDESVVYSSDNALYLYDIDNDVSNMICDKVQFRDLIVYNHYIYGVNDSEGISQLYVVDLLNNEVIRTNYTNVNSFTVSDDGLNIDMKLPTSKLEEIGTDKIDVSTYSAVVDAEEVNNSNIGLDNIINNCDNNISLFSAENVDMPVLMATVTLSSLQPAMFVMDTLYVTQRADGSFSHQDKNAVDFDGSLGGTPAADVKAPFDGVLKYKADEAWNNCHAVWFESSNIVQYANGSTGYMTVLVMHDDDISNVYAGQVFSQGQVFYQEGTFGPSSGQHLHLECINGTAGSYAWQKRGNVLPNDALWLYSNTNVQNKGGYTWRTWSGSVIPEVPTDTEAPTNAVLSVNKSLFVAGETVCFSASSQGAKGYTIGIYRNGERIYTGDVNSIYETSFSESGIYTAYITAWNNIGSVDSSNITFTIYSDIGANFYAYIGHQATGKWLSNTNGNIEGSNPTGNTNQIWNFIRQPDGSYIIKNMLDNSYMDVWGTSTETGTNVYCCSTYTGDVNQRFFIYHMYGAYYFRPVYTNMHLDMSSVTYNLELWGAGEDWAPQEFNIQIIDENGYLPQNIGEEFYAYIGHQSTGKWLANVNSNIEGSNLTGDNNQIWHFIRQFDGSYVIKNMLDNSYMDVWGTSTETGTNIYCCSAYTGDVNQRFFIYHMYDAYYFRPVYTNMHLDMSSVTYNLELWGAGEDWAPQEFNIQIIDENGYLPQNIGNNFFATIKNVSLNKYLTNNAGNIEGKNELSNLSQLWNFIRQPDGSYIIKNMFDNSYMDVWGTSTETGTNIYCCSAYTGDVNQRFFIYHMYDAYYFRPVYTNMHLDMSSITYNLELWGAGVDWDPQEFEIKKYELNSEIHFQAENATNVPETIKKIYGSTVTISDMIPIRENYKFLNWNTRADGMGTSYNVGDTYTTNESVTLYAQWENLIPYTDSIVIKNGSSYYVNVVPVNIEESCEVIVAAYKGGKFVTLTSSPYNSDDVNTTLSGDIDEIKVMVWNSLSGLKPLCEAEVIPSSEFIIE